MKYIMFFLLFLPSLSTSSERQPLISKKTKQNIKEDVNTKIFITKIKNSTQQSLKITVGDEMRFVVKPGISRIDIPLSFEKKPGNLWGLDGKVQVIDENNNSIAKFSSVIDCSSADLVTIIFFVSMPNKRDQIAQYEVAPKKSYDVMLTLSGKKNLETIDFELD